MVSGEHFNVPVSRDVRDELIRIKYARRFKNLNEVILDLLDDNNDCEKIEYPVSGVDEVVE